MGKGRKQRQKAKAESKGRRQRQNAKGWAKAESNLGKVRKQR